MPFQGLVAAAARAALLVVCAASTAAGQPAAGTDSLGRVIDQAVSEGPDCVGGLAIGVTQGKFRADRFYGDTGNHGPPNSDTEFEIGSITKTFTATLLAFADQRGTMHLSDPLARYAPQGNPVPNFHGREILLIHLATHTSGLPRVVPMNYQPPLMPEVMWRFVTGYGLTRPPGEQFDYSNLGYGLLARAIVRHTRLSEDQLYAQFITQPIGMHDTAIALAPAQYARLAQGHDQNGRPVPEFGPAFPAMNGAGGLRSTLNDMMRYLDFQLGRIDVPLRSLLPALHQPRHAKRPNSNDSVGLGWHMRQRPNGLTTIYHEGAMPGYSSIISFAPSRGTGIVILSNQAQCQVGKIAARVMGTLNGIGPDPMDPQPDNQNWN